MFPSLPEPRLFSSSSMTLVLELVVVGWVSGAGGGGDGGVSGLLSCCEWWCVVKRVWNGKGLDLSSSVSFRCRVSVV